MRGRGGKRRVIVPEWRCAAIGAAADGTPLLFAAINHAGGPGWLARIPLGGGAATATVQAYAKVARAPLTAIDVASPARGGIVAVGTNDGEAIVLDGATLAPLTRVQVTSDIWVSTLTLSAGPTAPPSPRAPATTRSPSRRSPTTPSAAASPAAPRCGSRCSSPSSRSSSLG